MAEPDILPHGVVPPEAQDELDRFIRSLETLGKTSVNLGPQISEIKKFAKENNIAESTIDQMISTIGNSNELFKRYVKTIESLKEKTIANADSQKSLHNQVRATMSGFLGINSSIKESINKIKESNNVLDEHKGALINQLSELKRKIELEKKSNLQGKANEIVQKKIARATESYSDTLKRQKKIVSSIGGDFTSFAGAFGAQAMTIANAKKSILTYNQSLFDLQRTYSVFQTGTSDLSSAFKMVNKETTFSNQQFAAFANTIASGYVGMTPTVTQIAEFASVLQTQFGPNVEVATEAAKQLLGIFENYPPALNSLMEVGNVMKTIKVADQKGDQDVAAGARKRLDVLRTTLLVTGEYGKMNADQREKLLKLTDETSAKENSLLETNKSVTKVQQESANALLEMGKAIEPSIKTIADGMSSVLGLVNNLGPAALGGVAAFQAVSSVIGSQVVQSMQIVPGQIQLWIDRLEAFGSKTEEVSGTVSTIGRAPSEIASPSRVSGRSSGPPPRRNALSAATSDRGMAAAIGAATPNGSLIPDVSKAGDIHIKKMGLAEKIKEIFRGKERGKETLSHKQNNARAVNASKKSAGHLVDGSKRAASNLASTRGAGGTVGTGGAIPKTGIGGKMAAGAKAGAVMGLFTAGMAGYSTYSQSKSKGFSSKQSAKRGVVSAAGSGIGTIAGGAIGAIGGPVGIMIGASVGGIIGKSVSDAINKGQELKKAREDAVKDSKNFVTETEAGTGSLGKMLKKYDAIEKTHEYTVDLLTKQRDLLKSQTDALNELFMLSSTGAKKAYSSAFAAASKEINEVDAQIDRVTSTRKPLYLKLGLNDKDLKTANSTMEALNEKMKGLDNEKFQIEVDIASNGDDAELTKQKKIEDIERKRNALGIERTRIYDLLKKKVTSLSVLNKGMNNIINGNLSSHLKMNSAVEKRLSAERSLMESANFGMGASIKMMQKQVNLHYDSIRAIQEKLRNQDQLLAKNVTENELIKSLAPAQKAVVAELIKKTIHSAKEKDYQTDINATVSSGLSELRKVVGADKDLSSVKALINGQVENFNQLQSESLSKQQKIADLTKDVREGYLDALREMSSGAGEFEKIIGTQEMGATQLMKTVDEVADRDPKTKGKKRLNTMGMGGETDTTTAAGKARIGGFARHTIKGFDTGKLTGAAQEARNTDIYNFDKAKEKFERESRGEGAAPTAGVIGTNKDHSNTLDAIRESNKSQADATETGTYNGTYNGMVNAIKDTGFGGASDNTSGGTLRLINRDIRPGGRGAPGQASGTPFNAANFGANLARGSTQQEPARTNIDTPALTKGPLPETPEMIKSRAKSRTPSGETQQKIPGTLGAPGTSETKRLTSLERSAVSGSDTIDELENSFKKFKEKEEQALDLYIVSLNKKIRDPINKKEVKKMRADMGSALKRLTKLNKGMAKDKGTKLVETKLSAIKKMSETEGGANPEEVFKMMEELSVETATPIEKLITDVIPNIGSEGGTEALEATKKYLENKKAWAGGAQPKRGSQPTGRITQDLSKKTVGLMAGVKKGMAGKQAKGKDLGTSLRGGSQTFFENSKEGEFTDEFTSKYADFMSEQILEKDLQLKAMISKKGATKKDRRAVIKRINDLVKKSTSGSVKKGKAGYTEDGVYTSGERLGGTDAEYRRSEISQKVFSNIDNYRKKLNADRKKKLNADRKKKQNLGNISTQNKMSITQGPSQSQINLPGSRQKDKGGITYDKVQPGAFFGGKSRSDIPEVASNNENRSGNATITIKLAGPIEGQVESLSKLEVAFQHAQHA